MVALESLGVVGGHNVGSQEAERAKRAIVRYYGQQGPCRMTPKR